MRSHCHRTLCRYLMIFRSYGIFLYISRPVCSWVIMVLHIFLSFVHLSSVSSLTIFPSSCPAIHLHKLVTKITRCFLLRLLTLVCQVLQAFISYVYQILFLSDPQDIFLTIFLISLICIHRILRNLL